MNLGIRILLSFFITLMTIALERGIPVKFEKGDVIIYTIEFVLLNFISGI